MDIPATQTDQLIQASVPINPTTRTKNNRFTRSLAPTDFALASAQEICHELFSWFAIRRSIFFSNLGKDLKNKRRIAK